MMSLPRIDTERLNLEFLNIDEARLTSDYFSKNKDHLRIAMPALKTSFFELPYWKDRKIRYWIKL